MNAVSKLRTQRDLQGLARQLRDAAEQIDDLEETMVVSPLPKKGCPDGTSVVNFHHHSPAGLAQKAADLIASRQYRKELFPEKMFGEPAWDILIDIYCHEVTGKPVSVSSACVAGGAAHATGLRWLRYLTDAGFVRREPDDKDLRYEWVRLETEGRRRIEAYLKSL